MKQHKSKKDCFRMFYRLIVDPFPGRDVYLVPWPVVVFGVVMAVITVVGFATTVSTTAEGFHVQMSSEEKAQQLRKIPEQLLEVTNQSHSAGEINEMQRQAEIARIEEMRQAYNKTADEIEFKGNQILDENLWQSLKETIWTLNPATKISKLIELAKLGKFIDLVKNIHNTYKSLEKLYKLGFGEDFDEEQERLRQEIEKIKREDQDAFFIARMRIVINFLRKHWLENLRENPCKPDEFTTWAKGYVKERPLVQGLWGPGEQWETFDAFFDWLMTQVRYNEELYVTQTYKGEFTLTNTKIDVCHACTPSSIPGTVELKINLETCKITGNISAEGEGSDTISVCRASDYTPIEGEKCSSQGKMDFNGPISGSLDPSIGSLKLDPTTVTLNHTFSWFDCNYDLATTPYHGEQTFQIEGEFDVVNNLKSKDPKIDLEVDWKTDVCHITGKWVASLRRILELP